MKKKNFRIGYPNISTEHDEEWYYTERVEEILRDYVNPDYLRIDDVYKPGNLIQGEVPSDDFSIIKSYHGFKQIILNLYNVNLCYHSQKMIERTYKYEVIPGSDAYVYSEKEVSNSPGVDVTSLYKTLDYKYPPTYFKKINIENDPTYRHHYIKPTDANIPYEYQFKITFWETLDLSKVLQITPEIQHYIKEISLQVVEYSAFPFEETNVDLVDVILVADYNKEDKEYATDVKEMEPKVGKLIRTPTLQEDLEFTNKVHEASGNIMGTAYQGDESYYNRIHSSIPTGGSADRKYFKVVVEIPMKMSSGGLGLWSCLYKGQEFLLTTTYRDARGLHNLDVSDWKMSIVMSGIKVDHQIEQLREDGFSKGRTIVPTDESPNDSGSSG
jgi:hypothetical protein